MNDLLRETAFGGLLRLLSSNYLLQYPEEDPNFIIPTRYRPHDKKLDSGTSTPTTVPVEIISEAPVEPLIQDVEKGAPERDAGLKSSDTTLCGDPVDNRRRADYLVDCMLTTWALITSHVYWFYFRRVRRIWSCKSAELDVTEARACDGNYLVSILLDPWNFRTDLKFHDASNSCLTFAVYIGSSLIISGFPSLAEEFGTGSEELTVTLSGYVFACQYS